MITLSEFEYRPYNKNKAIVPYQKPRKRNTTQPLKNEGFITGSKGTVLKGSEIGNIMEMKMRAKELATRKLENIPVTSALEVTQIPSKSTTRSYTFRDMEYWNKKKAGLAAVGLVGLGAASYGVYKYMNRRKNDSN